MSEVIQKNDNRAAIHWKLLTGASALALTGYLVTADLAQAADADKPLIWIDLGAQLEGLGTQQQTFAPLFVLNDLDAPYNNKSPLGVESPSKFAFGEEARLTFQPEDSDWVFSAGIRFGRANGTKHRHQQTSTRKPIYVFYLGSTLIYNYGLARPFYTESRFSDALSEYNEKHTILDFSAGKDVGLGLFGQGSNSIVSLGVRFAQFRTHANTTLRSMPVNTFAQVFKYKSQSYHTSFYAHAEIARSFRGIGPSLSWTGSAPIAGNTQDGELAIDWGVDGALLFGRQTVRGSHETTGRRINGGFNVSMTLATHYSKGAPIDRSRKVTVPNLGASFGLSYRFSDAKVSIGYRADTFFNAMDGGIDTRKSENRSFFGPYASISIGFGD